MPFVTPGWVTLMVAYLRWARSGVVTASLGYEQRCAHPVGAVATVASELQLRDPTEPAFLPAAFARDSRTGSRLA